MGEGLPPGWAWATLGEIATKCESVSPARTLQDRGHFIYVDLSAVQNGRISHAQILDPKGAPSRARQLIQEGDTLFSCVRVYLENIAFVTQEYHGQIASTAFAVLRPLAEIDPKYLYWLTRSPMFLSAMKDAQRGNSPPAVQDDDVRAATIPLAPAPEQRRIAKTIELLFADLDEAEAALARAREGVDQFRASLLHAACTGELTAEWRKANPPTETGADLLRRILAERRAAWERTERARLEAHGTLPRGDGWKARYEEPAAPEPIHLHQWPDGWAVVTVEAIGTVQLGRQRAPQYHSGANMRPYLRVANVFEDRIDTSDVMQMEFDQQDFMSYRLYDNDILLNEGQSVELVGRPAMFRGEIQNCCFTNTLVRFRSGPFIIPEFALMVFRDWMRTGRFRSIAKITTNIAHLGAARFANLSMLVPPLAEQAEIVRIGRQALLEVEALGTDLMSMDAQSTEARQALLHAAFSGKLVPQDPSNEPAFELLNRLRPTAASATRARRRIGTEAHA